MIPLVETLIIPGRADGSSREGLKTLGDFAIKEA